MKKIIAFFKRLFGVKAEVIVIPEPTKKKRKPRNKRKPKPINSIATGKISHSKHVLN